MHEFRRSEFLEIIARSFSEFLDLVDFGSAAFSVEIVRVN